MDDFLIDFLDFDGNGQLDDTEKAVGLSALMRAVGEEEDETEEDSDGD